MHARPGVNVKNEKIEQGHSVDKLVELYPKLARYCQFLSQNKWDGEDLAQETMYKAMKHYQHKTEINSALLNRIAHNLWVDTVRKHGRETIGSVPEEETDEKRSEISQDLVDKLIQRLTPKQSIIFMLKEGFKYQISEIAEALDMSETAVKSILNRTRSRLEKITDEDVQSAPALVWPIHDQETIRSLLYEALRTEDPTRLLRIAPEILTKQAAHPRMFLQKQPIRSASSPSGHLSMAA
ncbi:sigma-70 family RNA polymerase sigma factor [Pseudalkalibacillus decolorationis]|uniref:sigma-70 family RNA polymerase sigma factor n=1 Tax=Pseudalkalibacillus decolorationis TaxID=163879 RepID=UPI00214848A3|nr:sigma-70 family RNA polymerase sigma factor [Pseudalkalibacillus decolorationis]